jgi:hypothetical protein
MIHQSLAPTFKDIAYHPVAEDVPRLNEILERMDDI